MKGLTDLEGTSFLKKVTEVVPGIIYIYNQRHQRNEYSNRSVGETLGYTAQEVQAMGSEFMPQLCHPEDLDKVIHHMGRLATLKDGEVAQLNYRMQHKDGRWVWLLSHDTIFERDTNGNVLRHIGIASDVTAQKAAEQRAIEEKQAAKATSEELRAFAYSLSHDIKAPSNTLHLLLNELLETHQAALPEDAIELLHMALTTVDRMGIIIEDVLNYTRVIDHSRQFETVDLQKVLSDVIGNLHSEIHRTCAQVDVAPMPSVHADPGQMRSLFQNLIGNAIKFQAPSNAPHVQVSAVDLPDLDRCQITVADNGIGIPQNQQEKIFTIFKRLNAEENFAGTGLGLAICRRIATNHSGKITVSSDLGKGTRFAVDLASA